MLWGRYVFCRGDGALELWDDLFRNRLLRVLYIAGKGFDLRARWVIDSFVDALGAPHVKVEKADLFLLGLEGYELSSELVDSTAENVAELSRRFSAIGSTIESSQGSGQSEDDLSGSVKIRETVERVLSHLGDYTDVVLDVSSLPRVTYLSLMTSILRKLVPDVSRSDALAQSGVNFQVLVAEDARLDAAILSEDPSNDLAVIPGFSSLLHLESVQDWALVWFPILGENRVAQLEKVMNSVIPSDAEVCPVVPHPCADPRRADRLLVEYNTPLFRARNTPASNILHAHESHPFEAYRQILNAMVRYRDSMCILGGCRLLVTPLASKLITIGAGLACFEMEPNDPAVNFGVAIPYAEPTRYSASKIKLQESVPEVCSMLLTGTAYARGQS